MPEKDDNTTEETPEDFTPLNGAVPAPTPPVPEADLNSIAGFNIDDLIPENLRKAVTEHQKVTQPVEEDEEEEVVDEPLLPTLDAAEDNQEFTADNADFSPEALDRLLKEGDIDAIIKKPTKVPEDTDDLPFWHEDDDYKALTQHLYAYGLEANDVDKVLQKVIDKSTLDNRSLVDGLNEEINNLKSQYTNTKSEIERLRELERVVRFEESEETKKNYLQPIYSARDEVDAILEREGIKVSAAELFQAKDVTGMTKLLGEHDLEGKDLNTIRNHFRNYKDLVIKYNTDREAAKQSLKKVLKTNISDDTVKKVYTNQVNKLLTDNEALAYIREGLKDRNKIPNDVVNVLVNSEANFKNFVEALNSPQEHVFSPEFLNDLAAYVFNAAHNERMAKAYTPIAEENNKLKEALVKVSGEYKKLVKSAKGIQGSRGGVGTTPTRSGKKAKSMEEIAKEHREEIQSGDFLDKILGIVPSD